MTSGGGTIIGGGCATITQYLGRVRSLRDFLYGTAETDRVPGLSNSHMRRVKCCLSRKFHLSID